MNATTTSTLLEPLVPGACRARPLSVSAHGQTHVGRVRRSNEDHFLVAQLARTLTVRSTSVAQVPNQFSTCRGHIFLVADGMGGHRAGEEASSLTVLSLEAFFLNSLKRFSCGLVCDDASVLREFQRALQQADARIFEVAGDDPEMLGMGTTLTVAFAVDRKLFLAHAGDSRCYLLTEGGLQQVTHDHTAVAEMVARGLLTPEEASRSRFRNVVTNALGGNRKGVQAEVHALDLSPGDSLLLCSDGLCGNVSDERIAEIMNDGGRPQAICRQLIDEANDHGGNDKITAIVAQFGADDADATLAT